MMEPYEPLMELSNRLVEPKRRGQRHFLVCRFPLASGTPMGTGIGPVGELERHG
jgi:hypothetical protein